MKAKNSNFLEFLSSTEMLEVPVYQRPYSWSLNECQQLWDDLISLAKNNTITNHFLGFLVYINNLDEGNKTVIDGQQRLISISLLLAAINKKAEGTGSKNDTMRARVRSQYLLNNFDPKLVLKRDDEGTYTSIISNSTELPLTYSRNIIGNFEFFNKKIQSQELTINEIITALQKLEIIEISLEDNRDNPQLIFDSLNSTGIRLSPCEQIKNYLLMGQKRDEQEILYNEFWAPMEKRFNDIDSNLLEQFLADYLITKQNAPLNTNKELYSDFIAFYNKQLQFQTPIEIIGNICKYSEFYIDILENNFENEEVTEVIERINCSNRKGATPFLMEVLDDFSSGLITVEIFYEILKSVDSFIARMGLYSDNPTSTFINLSQNINKMIVLKGFEPKNNDKLNESQIKIKDLIKT